MNKKNQSKKKVVWLFTVVYTPGTYEQMVYYTFLKCKEDNERIKKSL